MNAAMPIPPEPPRVIDHLLTKQETAAQLGISGSTVMRLIASGALAAIKVGGQTRIRESELRRFVDDAPAPQLRPQRAAGHQHAA